MNLDTITMGRAEARKQFLDYRRAVRRRHSDEDAQIMRCYRALSQGLQIINIHDAIAAAGCDDKGRPLLAIARADVRVVFLDDTAAHLRFCGYARSWRHSVHAPERCITVPRPEGWRWFERSARAVVPVVPAGLRPSLGMEGYHILWEADWQDIPRDPALLKHVGGPMYAVLATWDLTEVERAVLRLTRARQR